ncbi:hypothetical protein EVAR_37704_1 [Eumeta japonica]|uniref:Uncharacterized protein n=1 Tax=Eumeta variegata TaxID=151549 RepID=A0A4C1XQ42_EUMVA|nr:hypothetical protein EVAR_37704_1 [Eumeta japonica]
MFEKSVSANGPVKKRAYVAGTTGSAVPASPGRRQKSRGPAQRATNGIISLSSDVYAHPRRRRRPTPAISFHAWPD